MFESWPVMATWVVDSGQARRGRVLDWLDGHQPAVNG